MKRAQSNLIDAFLVNVRKGLIIGRDGSSGPVVLEHMAAALEAIKAGADPDQALEVTRSAGNPADPINMVLAFYIHRLRQAGDTWDVVELEANGWLAEQGRDPVTQTRLKQVYKEHRNTISLHEGVTQMTRLTGRLK